MLPISNVSSLLILGRVKGEKKREKSEDFGKTTLALTIGIGNTGYWQHSPPSLHLHTEEEVSTCP